MEQLASLLPLLLIVAVFWFVLLRPARNQQQRLRRVQQSLQVGTRVVTSAGLHVTVVEVHDRELVVAAMPSGVELTIERQAVVRVLDDAGPETAGGTWSADEPPEGPGTGG